MPNLHLSNAFSLSVGLRTENCRAQNVALCMMQHRFRQMISPKMTVYRNSRMKLNIGRSLIVFGIVVSVGLIGSMALKKYIFEELKVNGIVYHDIALGKDLVADIVPNAL